MGKFQMDSTLVCQKCGRSTLVKYATHWLNEPHKIYTGYRVVRCPEHWTEWAMRNGIDNLRVVREAPTNRDLLYVGTARGVFVSLNRGQNWQRFMTGLPTVPVYDLGRDLEDRLYFTMKKVEGQTLRDILDKQSAGTGGEIQLTDALRQLVQIDVHRALRSTRLPPSL